MMWGYLNCQLTSLKPREPGAAKGGKFGFGRSRRQKEQSEDSQAGRWKPHSTSTPSSSHAPSPMLSSVQFSRSVVSDSATPRIAARQASLSITNSRSSLRLTSIQSVMPSSRFILCRPLLLLPSIPPSIRVFSNEQFQNLFLIHHHIILILHT